MTADIIAIIPAAGKGSRFGMPKVDATYNGITFSNMIISTLEEAGIAKHILVRDVETSDMLATIRIGMQRAQKEYGSPDGWLIWPVDHPTVRQATIEMLVSSFAENRNSIIIPRNQDKNGHPIIIPGSMVIPDRSNPLGLKGIIMDSGFPVLHLNVDDVGILFNFNTPEDVVYV
jgi:molybdenum cofactor cytidylyltransferase